MKGGIKSFFLLIWRVVYPLALYEIVVGAVYLLGVLFWGEDQELVLSAAGAVVASVILGALYENWRRKGDIVRIERELDFRQMTRVFLLGCCSCVCINLITALLPVSWEEYERVSESIFSSSVTLQLLCAGVIVPLAEELVFRGLVYGHMRSRMPAVPSMILSAVYFGWFHGNLVQGIYATILGLILAWLMEHYNTLAAPYLLHMSANMMSVLVTSTKISVILVKIPEIYVALEVLCTVGTVYLLLKIRKEDKNNDTETFINRDPML